MANMRWIRSGRITGIAVLGALIGTAGAQNTPDPSRQAAAQVESRQSVETRQLPIEQVPDLVCTGKVVKLGNRLVLSTPHATYLLEDQSQVRPFLNGNVKVMGVLDAVAGTIRVDAIGPA